MAAPSLWLLDAANALGRRTVRGELTAAEAAERLTERTKAPGASVPLEQNLPEAMSLAVPLNYPVYDMERRRVKCLLSRPWLNWRPCSGAPPTWSALL